jgi:hypothetical protein
MTITQINQLSQQIAEEIKRPVSVDSPIDCLEKLNLLVSYLGNSTECLAKSDYHYQKKLADSLEAVSNYKATEQKLRLNAMCINEAYCLNFAEKVNKDLHYAIEGLRTIVSAQKNERNQTF